MKKINFTKMQGSGNDFVIIEERPALHVARNTSFIKNICDRKFGIGADGVLLLEKSKKADVRMRIFNADGTEAEMCGNGARCCALYYATKNKKKKITIETLAGCLAAEIDAQSVKLKMTDPLDLRLDYKVEVDGKVYEADYVNTGVPHVVVEVDDLEKVPLKRLGRSIRYHQIFQPAGTNVDFIKVIDSGHIRLRTYERGVEDETLACGTGSVASAIIAVLNHSKRNLKQKDSASMHRVYVATQSGEELKVYFKILKKIITNVWLEGTAQKVFKGEYCISQ
jgi:diaminopimelate epimerase